MSETMQNFRWQPENSSGSNVTRTELHFRQIDIRGFQRSDGLFEVEGRVVDRKPRDLRPDGTPLHNMGVRLVFDDNLVVRDVQTVTEAAPYEVCPAGGLVLQELKGLSMTSGWTREVRNRLSRARSCTHLVELLGPLATVAFQTISPLRKGRPEALDASGRPVKIDSCFAYAADGDLVRRRWPEFQRPASTKE